MAAAWFGNAPQVNVKKERLLQLMEQRGARVLLFRASVSCPIKHIKSSAPLGRDFEGLADVQDS
jgi:hypothetical protein